MGNDFDLEWDDYDLRPKIEETDDGVELVLPENYLPLVSSRGLFPEKLKSLEINHKHLRKTNYVVTHQRKACQTDTIFKGAVYFGI